MNRDRGFLERLSASRARVLELLAGAIVLGFGINLLATWVADRLDSAEELAVALVASIGALLFLAWRAVWPSPRERTMEGFIIVDRQRNRLVEHPHRYKFASELADYLSAVFAENDAVRASWDRHPLAGPRAIGDTEDYDESKSGEIVRQAAEYFVISHLSMHLADYFNTTDFEQSELQTLSHTDIPDVLLQNRFLRMFAEPMEERAAFSSDQIGKKKDEEEGWTTVLAHGKGGARYERFELVLPKGGKVSRVSPTTVKVSTKRFSLELTTEAPRWATTLPTDYENIYLGLGSMLHHEFGVKRSTRKVDVSVRIVPNRIRLVSPLGWGYYRWIDEWLEVLERDVDRNAYFSDIGYQTAYTAYVLSTGPERAARADADADADTPRLV